MCYCPTPTLHLNLALTGDGAFLLPPQKTHSVWFISILNYRDTENVLINHLLLVIPVSLYKCVLINHIRKHAHTHACTHARTHTHTHYIAKSTGTTPSLEEKRVLPKCGNKDENIIKVLKNSIFTSVATVLKCMKWLYQYVQVIGVWWWILGSRSAFKVTPEVFSWD